MFWDYLTLPVRRGSWNPSNISSTIKLLYIIVTTYVVVFLGFFFFVALAALWTSLDS